MDESTAELQRLVEKGFDGAPIPDEDGQYPVALVYMRWWSSGTVDVVTVIGEDKATAYRASNLDPRRPEELDGDVVRWRIVGTVIDVTAEMLALPAPDGVVISARAADQLAVTHRAGELWTP